ncbi:MAG TPA: calcium/sodium antiporter [Coriobacteriia bacterium]|nr:calcium/sodium antiporter [Coriobacteriia bacterium]
MLAYLSAIGGLALLFGGGEALVRGAVAISRRLGLSPLLIGMTVVAWCTSAPELVVSLSAALRGSSDIAVGNIVGSNIFNILGVLGVAALIAPIAVNPRELRRDTVVMLAAAAALSGIALTGEIGRFAGLVLFAGMIAYVSLSYRSEKRHPEQPPAVLHQKEADAAAVDASPLAGVAYIAAGLAALVIGSRFLVSGASDIARSYGVAEAVIGLSLVAAGTSLPELATSIISALRRQPELAIGNVVGSNIFNILGILGVTALVTPVNVAEQIAAVDTWVMLGVSVILASALMFARGRIGRLLGAAFITSYGAYLYWLF